MWKKFEPQPTLAGDLVGVRPLRADDEDGLYAAAADPLIWVQHPVPDRWFEANFREYFAELLASGGALAVVDRASGEIIGVSRYHGYDAGRSEVEIGWTVLARAYWGGAYNAELKRLMLEHAFRFVDTVVFLVHPGNVRSWRAVEKIGARRVGVRPDAYGRESYVYEVTATSR